MFNLIKMDLYRLLRSKALRIGLVLSALIATGAMLVALGLVELYLYAEEYSPETAVSMLIIPIIQWAEGVNFAQLILYGTGILSLFVGSMIIASFIGAEQSCGYIKNIAGQLPNRGYIAISKFVAIALIQFLVLVVYTAVSILCAFVFFKKYIDGYAIVNLLGALGLRLLLYFAVGAVILFLCTLTKSHGLAMVTGAILGSGITNIGYFAANLVLSVMKVDVNISRAMPDGINGELKFDNLATLAPRALLVSVAFVAVFLTATALLLKKRDVK